MSITYNALEMLTSITDELMATIKFSGKDITELIAALESKEKDKKIFLKDMSILTAIVTLRGTNMSKIEDRTSDDGKRMFMKLKMKYEIQPHNKDVPMKNPTLPRIASLFPLLTMQIRKKYSSIIQPIGDSGIIPFEFMFPGGGALADADSIGRWLEWYKTFCLKVNMTYYHDSAMLGYRFSTLPESERFAF